MPVYSRRNDCPLLFFVFYLVKCFVYRFAEKITTNCHIAPLCAIGEDIAGAAELSKSFAESIEIMANCLFGFISAEKI